MILWGYKFLCSIVDYSMLIGVPYRPSEERGWELAWLMSGCFAPSSNLLKEVTLFFRSRSRNVIAVDCLGRMQKTLR